VKYAFIDRHRRSYEIKALCDALQVSRSGYYAARGRAPSARQERQAVLTAQILEIHTASRETYGAPRVHAELSAQKVPCCRNTVAKLMRHRTRRRHALSANSGPLTVAAKIFRQQPSQHAEVAAAAPGRPDITG
jgi:putative transposase